MRSRAGRIRAGEAALLAAGLLLGPPLSGSAQEAGRGRVGFYRPDDWITFADFRHVATVAVSVDVAYLGTTAGVERFDTLRGTWRSPVTAADGLPDGRVTALAVDPASGDLWIGTARGLARLQAFSGEIEAVWGPPPTRVDDVRTDPQDGSVYAFVASGWWVGRGGSPVLERSNSRPPARARGSIPVDEVDPLDLPWTDPLYVRSEIVGGEIFRLTALDRDPRGDWYVGTWGDNGRRWGAGRQSWESLYFGLAGPAGGPIVRSGDALWFVPGAAEDREIRVEVGSAGQGAARAQMAALARADDRGGWTYAVLGREPGLPAGRVAAAVVVADTLYLGSDHGLTRLVGAGKGAAATTWGWSEEPQQGPVTALAADGPYLWLGTTDGLVLWDRAGTKAPRRFLDRRRVTAILPIPGALFVGTADGLFVGRRPADREEGAFAPDSLARAETFGGDIRGLALQDTLVLVATDLGLEAFDRRTGEWRVTRSGTGRLPGTPRSLAADGEQVWIGTSEGLVRWRPATDEWQVYTPADGLAGLPVLHLLAETDAVWASTPAGASRFGWRSAGR